MLARILLARLAAQSWVFLGGGLQGIAITLAGGLGLLIYLILYVVLPEAKTTSQKIEMKGNPVNIKNITDAVKDEFDTVRKNMKL